jgi:hypothetical protein
MRFGVGTTGLADRFDLDMPVITDTQHTASVRPHQAAGKKHGHEASNDCAQGSIHVRQA